MPRAIQTVAGFFTAAGAGTGVATASPGDSFSIASFNNGNCYLEQVSMSGAVVDFVRIRSPRMHDANQGLRLWAGTAPRRSMLPWGLNQRMFSVDAPTVEIDATGAGTGGILVTYSYDDLGGAQPRLARWADVQGRIVQVSGVEVDVTSGAIGAWGASAAINSSFDNFEAGADYAWLGYSLSAACLGIKLTGKDTGNLGIGGPGASDDFETINYFVNMDQMTGRASVPIVAANNKGGTVLQNVDTAAATAVKATLILAQLG